MKTDYSQLLEKTIYLEGLIRIAVSRVEPEQELLAMLARESAALAEALACPKAETIQAPQAVPAPEVTVVETVVAPSAPAPIVETAPIVAPAEPAPAPAVTVAAPAVVAGNIVTAGGSNFNGFAVTIAHLLGLDCPDRILSGYMDTWTAEDYEAYLPPEAVEETKAMFSAL